MIIYEGDIQTISPKVTLSRSFINPFVIPLENVSLGVFKAKAQIGFFETQEESYVGDSRLRVEGFDLSKQHVDLTINVSIENGKYVIDVHSVDLQVADHLVEVFGLDRDLMTITTEPIV